MKASDESRTTNQFRANVIESVKTPLGFFSLVALIAEAALGATAVFIERPEKTTLVWSMIALVFILVVLVAVLAFYRPEALSGLRPEKMLTSNDETKPDPISNVDKIAQDSNVDPSLVDPKLVRFIPPLPPTKFKIVNLPRPEPPPWFNWPYAPTGKMLLYGIPFFLLPVTDQAGNPKGHLVIDVQPSKDNDPSTQIVEARVAGAKRVHFLISAGHGWRVHEGIQFLNRRIGYLKFRFINGEEQKVGLILGKHLREWAFGNSTNLVTEIDHNIVKPAWLSHNSTCRFDLLTIDIDNKPKDIESIEVTAVFEDKHPNRKISTPSIIVSAITIERSV